MPLIQRTMTAEALAAQRANARKSTGPRSRKGKSRTRLNAIKHGRHARSLRKKLVRMGDSEALAVYDRYAAAIKARFRACGYRELARVEQLVREAWSAWWRAQRRTESLARQRAIVRSLPSGAVVVRDFAEVASRSRPNARDLRRERMKQDSGNSEPETGTRGGRTASFDANSRNQAVRRF